MYFPSMAKQSKLVANIRKVGISPQGKGERVTQGGKP